jgi:hypothetical protein
MFSIHFYSRNWCTANSVNHISYPSQLRLTRLFFLNSYKFKYYLLKYNSYFYIVLRHVCLFICMSRIEKPFFEEPHLPDDPIDVVANLSEDEGKSHRPS